MQSPAYNFPTSGVWDFLGSSDWNGHAARRPTRHETNESPTRGYIPLENPLPDGAACGGLDFFPEKGEAQHKYTDLRRICFRCPIRSACLDYAIRNDERDGMWGGLTPRERAEIRKVRKDAAA